MSILPFSSGEAREGGGVSGAGEGHSLGAMDGLWNKPGQGVSGPVPFTRCGTPQPQASHLESEDDPPPWVGKLSNLRAFLFYRLGCTSPSFPPVHTLPLSGLTYF